MPLGERESSPTRNSPAYKSFKLFSQLNYKWGLFLWGSGIGCLWLALEFGVIGVAGPLGLLLQSAGARIAFVVTIVQT